MKKLINEHFDIDYPSGELSVSESFVGSLYDVYEKAFQTATKIEKESNMIALAEAQLLGFYHCSNNRSDIRGLIISMGLKKAEWDKMKEEYQLEYIDESDKIEIETYFSKHTGGRAGN